MSDAPPENHNASEDERRRRRADRRHAERRSSHALRVAPWEEQRAQYLTRFLFWALGLAYFNLGGATHTSSWINLTVVNTILFCYVGSIIYFMRHAAHRLNVPWRWRVTMGIDLFIASMSILADPAVISPGFLAYLMVILGNGMRYGLRFFAEAVAGSLLSALLIIGLRLFDYLDAISVSAVFFLLFFVIIVLYSYSLTANIDRGRQQLETERDLDHLTGLLNRRALHERVERLLQNPEVGQNPLVVLFADLDRFKAINDTHGHHVGDRVLTEISRMLTCAVRDSDLVARYGGDEFILVMQDTNLSDAARLAERLQHALSEWAWREDVDISFSIGLGQFPDHGKDLTTVIAHVDQAMYRSKMNHGRGGITQVGQQAAPSLASS